MAKKMTDQPKPENLLPISDPHRVETVFVNQVAGVGHLNGVVNVTLAVAQFTPRDDGSVDPDLVIAARLRMDLVCAQSLHEQIGKIIHQMLQPQNATTH